MSDIVKAISDILLKISVSIYYTSRHKVPKNSSNFHHLAYLYYIVIFCFSEASYIIASIARMYYYPDLG